MATDRMNKKLRLFLRNHYLLTVGCVVIKEGEPEILEPCEAEKRRASSAISNILSVLTHYSESAGRVAVCVKRPGLSSVVGHLSSSLTISLARIKQSFVL